MGATNQEKQQNSNIQDEVADSVSRFSLRQLRTLWYAAMYGSDEELITVVQVQLNSFLPQGRWINEDLLYSTRPTVTACWVARHQLSELEMAQLQAQLIGLIDLEIALAQTQQSSTAPLDLSADAAPSPPQTEDYSVTAEEALELRLRVREQRAYNNQQSTSDTALADAYCLLRAEFYLASDSEGRDALDHVYDTSGVSIEGSELSCGQLHILLDAAEVSGKKYGMTPALKLLVDGLYDGFSDEHPLPEYASGQDTHPEDPTPQDVTQPPQYSSGRIVPRRVTADQGAAQSPQDSTRPGTL